MENSTFNWSLLLDKLKEEISELEFNSWISPLSFKEVNGNVLTILSPSTFVKNWVEINFSAILLKLAQQIDNQIQSISIYLQNNTTSNNLSTAASSTEVEAFSTEEVLLNSNDDIFDIPLNPNYVFDNFVVGQPNEFAYNAAKSIATATSSYNPLFIHGGVGLGKTHLMHSIAWELKKSNPRCKVIYLTAEKFMNLFINALNDKTILSFKDIFRSTDILMIDDFQFMGKKESTQEEFFHTFNALLSQDKQLVFSADKSPHLLVNIEERIKSRLQAGLTININETNYELRLGILKSKIQLLKIKIPKDVIEFLAHTVTSNVRELEGCLNRLVSYHRIMNVDITIDLAMDQLHDVLQNNNKHIDIESIQKKVAEHYQIKFSDLISAKKNKQTVTARHIAVYIAKKLTKLSLAEIGQKFGGRDHTTIIYSVQKIEKEIKINTNLEHEIKLLMKALQQS